MHEFADWASVKKDRSLTFDWDDALGNAARREAGLRLEKMRNVRRMGRNGARGWVGKLFIVLARLRAVCLNVRGSE